MLQKYSLTTAITTLFFLSHHCLNGIIIIYLRYELRGDGTAFIE